RITDLAVYSLDGRRVATLNCETAPGDHVSVWDITGDSGESLSAGLYLIKLSAPGTVLTRKVMILN
ncbi:MAG: T9SS type A sorting domain-containing protein, partial [Candidatus Aegiribacteria sp.]|nr:T9SS type A sorting domain-containing protein [Candidatus Aegiribacteria sp.]